MKNIIFYVVIGIIVLVILGFAKSFYNQYVFSSYVTEIATADVVELDNDSTPPKKLCQKYNQIEDKNTVNYLLDILSKSNKLIGTNDLTFFFTFIVAVLSIFFGYKTIVVDRALIELEKTKNEVEISREKIQNEIDKVIRQKKEIKSVIDHSVRYNHILTRIASMYDIGVMIGNGSIALSQEKLEKENLSISKKVGELCSRLSLICDETNNRLKDKKQRLDFITIDEKDVIDTYLTDTIGELERSLNFAKHVEIDALCNIIANKKNIVEDIKETLNRVEIQEDVS